MQVQDRAADLIRSKGLTDRSSRCRRWPSLHLDGPYSRAPRKGEAKRYACGDVQEAALAHLKHIRLKIADLRRMERTLADTAARCEGGTAADCPIIDVLSRAPG